MTNQEASEIIKDGMEDMSLDFADEEQYEALTMAIKALEKEPSGDAISRQYLLDNCVVDKVTMPYVPISKIQEAPPITPQPRIGHWILTSDDDYEYCTCSECGYQNGENWMIGSQIKFCQECGAKMVEKR